MRNNRGQWRVFFLVFWILVPVCLGAQPAQWILKADSTRIWVGDPLRLVWEARVYDDEEVVEWPRFEGEWGPLEKLYSAPVDTQIQNDGRIYSQQIWITGFDSGLFSVPGIPLQLQGPGREPYTVMPDSLAIHIMTLEVDTSAAFRDIKDILPAPFSWTPWWIGFLLALILGFLGYWLYRRSRLKEPASEQVDPGLPLHEQTLKRLDELESMGWWQKGEVKRYYVELTDILRQYLEQRFQMAALEKTTEELVRGMEEHRELQVHRRDLGIILENADLAKFARASLSPEDHLQSLDRVRQFVRSTPEIIIERPKQR